VRANPRDPCQPRPQRRRPARSDLLEAPLADEPPRWRARSSSEPYEAWARAGDPSVTRAVPHRTPLRPRLVRGRVRVASRRQRRAGRHHRDRRPMTGARPLHPAGDFFFGRSGGWSVTRRWMPAGPAFLLTATRRGVRSRRSPRLRAAPRQMTVSASSRAARKPPDVTNFGEQKFGEFTFPDIG
jgi:hypothetical protein